MKQLTLNKDDLRADACATVLPRAEIDRPLLVLPHGAARATIVADEALSEDALLVAESAGSPALVQVAGDRVTVRPAKASLVRRAASALLWSRAATTLRLSTVVRWAIAIHGASCVTADLRALQLSALQINGGASDVLLDLPRPVGVVRIRFVGGVRAVTLRRPKGVPVDVVLSEGGSQLALDGQYLHSAAGPIQLAAHPETAPDRYVVSVEGGASRLIVDAREPAAEPPLGIDLAALPANDRA